MSTLEEFSKKFLLSVAVTCLTVGVALLKEEQYELGIILMVLGIVLLLIVAYWETLWKRKLETRMKTLERSLKYESKSR